MRFLKESLSKYDDPIKLYKALPKMVYHATLQEALPNIFKNKLKDAWIGQDINECIEYVKMNHDCDYEDIVVLEIPKKLLDVNKCDFTVDAGDGWSDEWSGTFIYNGSIDIMSLDSYWLDEDKWYYIKDIQHILK